MSYPDHLQPQIVLVTLFLIAIFVYDNHVSLSFFSKLDKPRSFHFSSLFTPSRPQIMLVYFSWTPHKWFMSFSKPDGQI